MGDCVEEFKRVQNEMFAVATVGRHHARQEKNSGIFEKCGSLLVQKNAIIVTSNCLYSDLMLCFKEGLLNADKTLRLVL
jgi:hypothetical protein